MARIKTPHRKARTRWLGQRTRPTWNQAQKIIAKFGGEAAIADALQLNPATVYKWTYGKPWGTDGMVPIAQVDALKTAARIHGIFLLPEDWEPERIVYTPLPSDDGDKEPTHA